MRLLQILGAAGLVVLVGAGSPSVFADDAGWYAGLNAGQSRDRIDDWRISDDLLGGGFGTTSLERADRHFAFKAFGGYAFDRYFALEGGYFNLGQFNFTANTLPAGQLHDVTKIQGVNLDAVAMAPIGDRFAVFGRFGVNYADVRDSASTAGLAAVTDPYRHRRSANYKFGVGVQTALTDSVAMRIEAERYRITDAVGFRGNVDFLSVGLLYRFGGSAAPQAPTPPIAMAATPEPVVAPPPPPPPPPPPAPVRERVQFSADSLFAFDRSAVKPAGQRALDAFAAQLAGSRFQVITVTGYTDRLGAHAYNLRLSARRAAAVKEYLVRTAGIPADKIVARGADGSDPVTKPGECKGTRPTAKLIACLQPDRRVEVDVEGTRTGDTSPR